MLEIAKTLRHYSSAAGYANKPILQIHNMSGLCIGGSHGQRKVVSMAYRRSG